MAFGLFAAALLYGDGIITPAIAVLSAVEGLDIATTGLAQWAVPPLTDFFRIPANRVIEVGTQVEI